MFAKNVLLFFFIFWNSTYFKNTSRTIRNISKNTALWPWRNITSYQTPLHLSKPSAFCDRNKKSSMKLDIKYVTLWWFLLNYDDQIKEETECNFKAERLLKIHVSLPVCEICMKHFHLLPINITTIKPLKVGTMCQHIDYNGFDFISHIVVSLSYLLVFLAQIHQATFCVFIALIADP